MTQNAGKAASERIAPVRPPYDDETRAVLEKWMPPNSPLEPLRLFRTLARHSVLRDRMRPLGSALLGKGTIPIRERELLILRTCARAGAEYEWGVHVTAFAGAAGLDDDAVARTLAPPSEIGIDGDERLFRFADELHDRGTVSDETWARVAIDHDEPQLLELLTICGFYHLISYVANGARVELEPWAARFSTSARRPR